MAFHEKLHIKFLRICRWNQFKFGTQTQKEGHIERDIVTTH